LGTLRAGAAYVPLDPAFPAARLEHMAADAQLRVVLARSADDVPRAVSGGRTCLTVSGATRARRNGAGPGLPRGEQLAYVLYTSGSTGVPKGVQVSHASLANLLCAMQSEPGIVPDERLCAVTTPSFDIAALELFLPLTVGARVVIARDAEVRDPAALLALLRSRECTMIQGTPSLLGVLASAGLDTLGRRLRVLSGGEPLPPTVAAKLLPACAELWNLYGPTETTIWSTAWRVDRVQGPVPLGRPIANTRVYVLDAHGNCALPGALGEIHIGGAGVAQGYLGRDEETARRFLPDPFAGNGARMYRTGDMGRLVDGVLLFAGRADQQIKLRGHRIEPGEIEAHALREQDVREAAAAVRGEDDERRLVLFVAADPVPGLEERLLARLERALPPYMVPRTVVVLDTLPRTANGKLDRAALPLVASNQAAAGLQPPSTPLEHALAAIWCELLHVDQVGVTQNFFDLGGHSLLAVRMFHRAEQATGVNLPLATLFNAPTIADLARAFADAGAQLADRAPDVPEAAVPVEDPWRPLVAMQAGNPSRSPLFLIHAVGGNVLNYQPLVKALGPAQPVYGLQSIGLDGRSAPLRNVEEMARTYLAAVRTVQPHGPYFLGGGSMGGLIAFEIAQLLAREGERVALLAMFDTYGPGLVYADVEHPRGWRDSVRRWLVRSREIDLGSAEGR
ncbi:MAG TPA: amino acid adenylation domain-containing protein, partial [Xanthomonadales bacterium]|nr:amino acid adenylation domain-containing protein [Xanthomonadales bacterium]